jgi:hypothetical protein
MAVESLSTLVRRLLTTSEIEDAFWVIVNNDRRYASGEIALRLLDSPIEVTDDDGVFSLEATLTLQARLVEELRQW